jgi:hypothetical protein
MIVESLIARCLELCELPYESQHPLNVVDSLNSKIRVDFFVRQAEGYPNGFIIESKWQDTSGSCDKKVAALCDNIKKYYGQPTIVVADGRGLTRARKSLRSQTEGNFEAILSFGEFISFCMSLCNGKGKRSIQKHFSPEQMKMF